MVSGLILLIILSVPDSKHITIGDRAFSYGAVVEWNKLPLELRNSSSVNVFKSKFKTYLFDKCYG